MNPAQKNLQMDTISHILDRSGTVVDIKLPKKARQGGGRPGGAPNKPKSTTRDPSKFEYLETKRKKEKIKSHNIKRKKEKEDKEKEKLKQK